LRIRRPIGVENRRRIYRFVEDSRRQWGVEDAALSPRDFFNGLLAYGHAELTGLSLLARRVDLDPEECLARLRAAGIQVKSPNQPVIEVAHANGLTPKLVYEAMQPPASEGPRPLSEEPPMGIGRQTLGQISATYGLELEELLRFFRERGLAPRKESTLRQLAEEKGVPSKQLYGELREHFAR
jgi:hypothetical protein